MEAIDAGRVLVGGAPASTAGPPGRRGRGDRAARRRGPGVRVARRAQARGGTRRVRDRRARSARGRRRRVDRRLHRLPAAARRRARLRDRRRALAARVVAAPGRARDGDGAHERARSSTRTRSTRAPICASPTCRSSRCAPSPPSLLALTDRRRRLRAAREAAVRGGPGPARPARHRARSRGARGGAARGRRRARRRRARVSARSCPSPLRGADGNVEFLVHARRGRGDGRRRPRSTTPSRAHAGRAVTSRDHADACVGLVPHRDRPVAHELAQRSAAWLVEHGVEVRVPADARAGGRARRVRDRARRRSRPASTSRSRSAATARCCTRCSSCTRRRCRCIGVNVGHARLPERARTRGARGVAAAAARGRVRGVGAHDARGRRRVGGRGARQLVRAQRGGRREAALRPPHLPRRVDQRHPVHVVRGRRADRRDADRAAPRTRSRPAGRSCRPTCAASCSRRSRRTCCSTGRSCWPSTRRSRSS